MRVETLVLASYRVNFSTSTTALRCGSSTMVSELRRSGRIYDYRLDWLLISLSKRRGFFSVKFVGSSKMAVSIIISTSRFMNPGPFLRLFTATNFSVFPIANLSVSSMKRPLTSGLSILAEEQGCWRGRNEAVVGSLSKWLRVPLVSCYYSIGLIKCYFLLIGMDWISNCETIWGLLSTKAVT